MSGKLNANQIKNIERDLVELKGRGNPYAAGLLSALSKIKPIKERRLLILGAVTAALDFLAVINAAAALNIDIEAVKSQIRKGYVGENDAQEMLH